MRHDGLPTSLAMPSSTTSSQKAHGISPRLCPYTPLCVNEREYRMTWAQLTNSTCMHYNILKIWAEAQNSTSVFFTVVFSLCVKGRIKRLYNTYTCTYINLKVAFDVFHKIWCVFYIQFNFNQWKCIKVYAKCTYVTTYSRNDNSHISCARVIDWLHIWYWQCVDES